MLRIHAAAAIAAFALLATPIAAHAKTLRGKIAAGPDGAVAVVFYDRRQLCPNDASVLPTDVGRSNFCIDTSLQAYKDSGSGAVRVGGSVQISQLTWDPEPPAQVGAELLVGIGCFPEAVIDMEHSKRPSPEQLS